MPIQLDQFCNDDFDRGASPLKEAFWRLLMWPIFGDAFPVPSGFRASTLRLFGATIGKDNVLRGNLKIHFPWRLSTGDHVWIGEGCTLLNLDWIEIEQHCCISQESFLCTGSHDPMDDTVPLQTGPIRVGAHSWIGARTFVGKGVEIGNQSLLAAGTVLMKSCERMSFVKGNPATISPRR